MQTHISKAYEYIDKHLPKDYKAATSLILEKSKIKVSDDVIRNVRTKRTTTNIDVLNALLQVARKAKKDAQTLMASID